MGEIELYLLSGPLAERRGHALSRFVFFEVPYQNVGFNNQLQDMYVHYLETQIAYFPTENPRVAALAYSPPKLPIRPTARTHSSRSSGSKTPPNLSSKKTDDGDPPPSP